MKPILNQIKYLAFVFACISTISVCAQKASIKGVIVDTSAKQKLQYAVVAIFNAKDSLLVTSARSANDGTFLIENLKEGKYDVLITYPKMADFTIAITLGNKDSINLGKVIMTSAYHLLQEVIVQSKIAAIRMKGDTLEYKADSFYVAPGSNIEALLKRLPGITVNRDGTIKAQGEKVQQVFVDGDEFFSDDPTLATKYLQASSVDKIQVYDRKSEQNGTVENDAGKSHKVINIQLKENSKRGYFGKLVAGSDANSFYNHEGMLNKFSDKKRISVFGTASNTGTAGLSYEDQYKFTNNSFEGMGNDSREMLFSYNDYDMGGFGNYGLPKNINAGTQFLNKWNANRSKVNGSYILNRQENVGWNIGKNIQTMPDSSTNETNSNATNHSINNANKASATLDVYLDSFSTLKIIVQGKQSTISSESDSYSEVINKQNGNFINTSSQKTISNNTIADFAASILWQKKYRKVGRNISVNLQHTHNTTNGQLQSEAINYLYDPVTGIPIIESPNQQQHNYIVTSAYAAELKYTEPVSKYLQLDVGYISRLTNTEKDRKVFGQNSSGKYENFIDSLSSDYLYKIATQLSELMLHYKKDKLNINVGGKISFTNLLQSGAAISNNNRQFFNFFPNANMQIKLKQLQSLNLNYSGYSTQPTIDQLQPLIDKSNSLAQTIGNPNLKPSFSHNVSLYYFKFNLPRKESVSTSFGFTVTQNAIISKQVYDQFNQLKIQYDNESGVYYMYGSVGYEKTFSKLGLRTGCSISGSTSSYINNLNNFKNFQKNNNLNGQVKIGYEKMNAISIEIKSSVSYSYATSALASNTARSYLSYNHEINASIYLPWKLELKSSAVINYQPANEVFTTSRNNVKWNASITKKTGKNGAVEIDVSVFDILNQNTGYQRYFYGNNISESRSNYIPRYGLLSVKWNFTHMHK